MTFQIFVGGQRVNSADVLNTPAWSHQDKSRKRDCGQDEDASENGNLRKRPSGAAGSPAPLAPMTNVALDGK